MLKNYFFLLFYNKLLCLVSIRVRCEFNIFSATERLFLDFHWNIFRFVGRYLFSVLLEESQCSFFVFYSSVRLYVGTRRSAYITTGKTYAFFITHRKKKKKVLETGHWNFYFFILRIKRNDKRTSAATVFISGESKNTRRAA